MFVSYRKTVWWIFHIGYLEQVLSRKKGVQLFWIDGRGGWNSTRAEIFVFERLIVRVESGGND
jgi:hypothetical protein